MSAALRLLADIEATIRRFVVLPGDHEAAALALFVAHTYALEGAHATPYLLIVSPEKRSGKTRLLEVLELMAARPWRVTSASEAAIYRKIAASSPTLLLDEIDAVFGEATERTEPLRALLNAGNRPGAAVSRCIRDGGSITVQDFGVFCPKVLAGIDTGHRIPDTIRDRSITVAMVRRTQAERVERFRYRDADAQTESLRESLSSWGADTAAELHQARPAAPPVLDDRAAEAWEPLFAIADLAGGEWPSRARLAAEALSGDTESEEQGTATLVLTAIRRLLNGDRMASAELADAINADEELPFGAWREGRGIDGRILARLLRPYGIRPRTIRLDDGRTPKGYLREQFSAAWERWLPHSPDGPPQAPHPPQKPRDPREKRLETANVADVADVAGGQRPTPGVADASRAGADQLCRYPAHRSSDWIGDGGRSICGVCHPQAGVRP